MISDVKQISLNRHESEIVSRPLKPHGLLRKDSEFFTHNKLQASFQTDISNDLHQTILNNDNTYSILKNSDQSTISDLQNIACEESFKHNNHYSSKPITKHESLYISKPKISGNIIIKPLTVDLEKKKSFKSNVLTTPITSFNESFFSGDIIKNSSFKTSRKNSVTNYENTRPNDKKKSILYSNEDENFNDEILKSYSDKKDNVDHFSDEKPLNYEKNICNKAENKISVNLEKFEKRIDKILSTKKDDVSFDKQDAKIFRRNTEHFSNKMNKTYPFGLSRNDKKLRYDPKINQSHVQIDVINYCKEEAPDKKSLQPTIDSDKQSVQNDKPANELMKVENNYEISNQEKMIRNYLTLSVVNFLLCNFLFGGLAMVFSCRTKYYLRHNKLFLAEKNSKISFILNIAALLCGFIAYISFFSWLVYYLFEITNKN